MIEVRGLRKDYRLKEGLFKRKVVAAVKSSEFSLYKGRTLGVVGEPGSGKSFLALHLAHAIAAGTSEWFGFRVRQMPVVYVALEGIHL